MFMRTLSLLAVLLIACSAQAAPRQIPLSPPGSEVAFRAYGMGLVPIDVRFSRFDGWLTYDPDDRGSCRVEIHVDAASLVTDDAALRDTIAGPDFLDTASFPHLSYAGTCEAKGLGGMLAMHGITRPFSLSLTWNGDGVVAEGRLQRADWGMTAMPVRGGRTVRIRVAVPLAGGNEQIRHTASAP